MDGPNDRIQKIVESRFCQRLSEFLKLSTEKDLVTPALRAVGNILTGDDMQTQVCVRPGEQLKKSDCTYYC